MKQNKLQMAAWLFVGGLYSPVFMLSIALHAAARLLLAISYFGMLEGKIGKDVLLSLFARNGDSKLWKSK